MDRPNFFIIGAPKCGTTSLAIYLREHPRIFFPALKEPHFFNTDMAYRVVRSESDYYAQFRGAGPDTMAIGEGSVFYLYSDAAVPNILCAIPDAKFIVMVRNPIQMAVSLHTEVYVAGDDNVKDFATAWGMQDARRNGARLPMFCRDRNFLLYGHVCSTGWQLKRLYSRVPRERVLVLLQDDLKREPRSVYLQTLQFLGVPDDGRATFPVYNSRHTPVRSQLVQVGLRGAAKFSLNWGIAQRLGLFSLIQRLNSRPPVQHVLSPELRAELANYFRDDIEQLSALLRRDLSGWLQD
jgi:hypothetical protein